jgi:hypothetical protein
MKTQDSFSIPEPRLDEPEPEDLDADFDWRVEQAENSLKDFAVELTRAVGRMYGGE